MELTITAAGFALQDALEKAHELDRRKWDNRRGPDYFMVVCALRDQGFDIIKKEPNG